MKAMFASMDLRFSYLRTLFLGQVLADTILFVFTSFFLFP